MARVEITIPGERIVEEFTALVPQTTVPATAQPVNVGLVEISQSQPTELIPGPVGPQGTRGSQWTTGTGAPVGTGALLGDMYLDDTTDAVWQWSGTAWVDTGTNIHGSPDTGGDILAKLLPVDGAGSGLDADLLDGQDSPYYLAWANLTGKPSTFPPMVPIAQSDVTNLVSDLAAKAPLASPTFTGDPKAPTPATADNDTSIATTAFVKAQGYVTSSGVTAVSGTAPVVSSGGMTPAISMPAASASVDGYLTAANWTAFNGKAPLASPAFTGTPTAPTPTAGDNDTSISTTAFVQAAIAGKVSATANSYNRVVNGAMQISQENGNTASAASATAIYYPSDQWLALWSTTGASILAAGGSVSPNNSRTSYFNVSTAGSFPAGGYLCFIQKMEGVRVADLWWGTAGAKPVVVRFWATAALAGTYSCGFRNASAFDRSYLTSFTLPTANEWAMITVAIPGDVAGTWPKDTTASVELFISFGSGTTYQGVAGWQAGNKLALTGQASGVTTTGNYSVADVGLYLDPNSTGIAPPWQMPDYASELAACQRYWQSFGPIMINVGSAADSTVYPTEFRVAPAVTGGGTGFITAGATAKAAQLSQTTRAFQTLLFNARM